MRKMYHLHIKSLNSDYYYGDLTILFKHWGQYFSVSKFKLDRWDFETPYEEENFIIKKGVLQLSTRSRK
jgi:hypothetical protein